MRTGSCITTYTGIQFYPLDPRIEEVSIIDISHALSLLCRANGHYSNFYSVAQHSLNCAKEAKVRGYSDRIQLACLLHDASEAYISDITRPMKKQFHDYLEIEKHLQAFIYTVYGISNLTEHELNLINEIDNDMLDYEMAILLNSNKIYEGKLIGKYNLQFIIMDEVENEFTRLVTELQEKVIVKEALL